MINKFDDRPLRICLLSYRSNPYCGGQGVYIRNLARAIKDMGHHIDVVSGPPGLTLDPNISVYRLKTLNLYDPKNLFRVPTLRELANPINMLEWLTVSTMGFPEPFIFGIKANAYLRNRLFQYDVVHDNQSLSYGVWAISKKIPTVATIHHPMTKDRDIAICSVDSALEKLKYFRWYSFIRMQKRVSRSLAKIVTVSDCSKKDIINDFGVYHNRIKVVSNGIDTELFRPIDSIKRCDGTIIVTNSSDSPLKGLNYLLKSVQHLCSIRKRIRLIVVGTLKDSGSISKLLRQLDIASVVQFTGRVDDFELVLQYARASVAVVPSIYEGFGLPAAEAMACKVPVVATTGGALPEVVGNAGLLVPPKDYLALSNAILKVLDNPVLAERLGELGCARVKKKFTWTKAAEETVKIYKEVIT